MHEHEGLVNLISKAKDQIEKKESDRLVLARKLKPFEGSTHDISMYPAMRDAFSQGFTLLNLELYSQKLTHYQVSLAWEAVGSLLSSLREGGVEYGDVTTFKTLRQLDKKLLKSLNLTEGELAIVSKLFLA